MCFPACGRNFSHIYVFYYFILNQKHAVNFYCNVADSKKRFNSM